MADLGLLTDPRTHDPDRELGFRRRLQLSESGRGWGCMKSKQICKQYNLNHDLFTQWLKGSGYAWKGALSGVDVTDDQDIDAIVTDYKQHIASALVLKEQADQAQRMADQARQAAMDGMRITTGFNFEGFAITHYAGYVCGDAVTEVGRGGNGPSGSDHGLSHMARLARMRQLALSELKSAAHRLGCNAVIGIDFDYPQVDQEQGAMGTGKTTYLPYLFGVVANGTAVVIEVAPAVGSQAQVAAPHDV